MIEKDLFYTREHEWVRVEGDTAVMGITHHAQEMLGDVTFVELPETGIDVRQKDTLSVVESSKAASDVYSPLSGTVMEVNETLESRPELINESCYRDGWICKLKIKDPEETRHLMNATDYEQFLRAEV